MKFTEASSLYSLNRYTYCNLRWIAYLGQLTAVIIVQFILEFQFKYFYCISIIFFSILTNIYLQFIIKQNQLNNKISTAFLIYDIIQLGLLLFLTGGITNPFILLLIIPSVFSSQYLNIWSAVLLLLITIIILLILTFFYYDLPHPDQLHFHAPEYYIYSIPLSIFIRLVFLIYFGLKFGNESRIRKQAFDQMQEIMAKENELLSLGGQAAAAAHSLGTPLSTILLTVKELKKEFGENHKINKDLDLLVSQSDRCRQILKKLSLNPNIEDEFIDLDISLDNYIYEIVRSFKEISNKNFIIHTEKFNNKIKTYKSSEIIYGLRNFIGNASKFSKDTINIFLISNTKYTEIIIHDDGPGFPKDLIDKHQLGEPYIRTNDKSHIKKYGLGLGTFIGKTLLEKNYAKIKFENNEGAKVTIKWLNTDLIKV